MRIAAVSDRPCDRNAAGSQDAVIAFLSSPGAHAGIVPERIDTHASVVWLAGPRAWKLKRAVRYEYLDYSSCERRQVMCDAEFRLGQRLAPQLYRRVVAVTRNRSGELSIGGVGTPVDWLIEMTRFDENQLLSRLAARGALDLSLMPALSDAIVHLHEQAERRTDHGGYAGMAWVVEGNAAAFVGDRTGALDPAAVSRLVASLRATTERLRGRLDARRDAGFVRRCHGDLHLANVVQLDGVPTLFDPIEFNDRIACVDVMYDVAFLLMDLERLSLRDHANALLNAYLGETSDITGLGALPLFLACRAAVRAKTSATAAAVQVDPAEQEAHRAAAAGYLHLADVLIHPAGPGVVAVGGHSGSGKSSLARRLAAHVGPAPGAVVVRSDVIRKRIFGVDPFARLGPDAYATDVSDRVYEALISRACSIAAEGHGVVVDGVFLSAGRREALERAVREAGVPFVGLWLDAPESVLIGRVADRRADASDATTEIIRAQLREPTGDINWHRINASGPADRVLDDARRIAASLAGTSTAGRAMASGPPAVGEPPQGKE